MEASGTGPDYTAGGVAAMRRSVSTTRETAAEPEAPDGPPRSRLRRTRSLRLLGALAGVVVVGVSVGVAVTSPSVSGSDGSSAVDPPAMPVDPTAMPVGNLPGWRQIFVDDFSTDVPLGSFPGTAYGGRWSGYEGQRDTSGEGTYTNQWTVSVHDGVMDIYLRTENGTPLVAAPQPRLPGRYGQTYGRYSVRFRADPVPGYKTAWLLWPDSDQWADGEIDWPEGPLSGDMYAANLRVGSPGVFDLTTGGVATYGNWHIATTEWTPQAVVFFLDGREIGRSTSVPTTPMHWILQTETDHGRPPADAAGHVEVDWVAVYERA